MSGQITTSDGYVVQNYVGASGSSPAPAPSPAPSSSPSQNTFTTSDGYNVVIPEKTQNPLYQYILGGGNPTSADVAAIGKYNQSKVAQESYLAAWKSSSDAEKSYYAARKNGMSSDSFLAKAQANYDSADKDVKELEAQIEKLKGKQFFSIRDRAEVDSLQKQLDAANAKYSRYDEELGLAKGWKNDEVDSKWESDQYAAGATDKTIQTGLMAALDSFEKQRNDLVNQRQMAEHGSQFAGEEPTYGKSNQETAVDAIDGKIAELDRQIKEAQRRLDRAGRRFDKSPLLGGVLSAGKETVNAADAEFLNNFSVTDSVAGQSDYASWSLDNPGGTVEDYGRTILADRRPNDNWTPSQLNRFYLLQSSGMQDEADRFAVSVNRSLNDAARGEATSAFSKFGRGFDMSKKRLDGRSVLGNIGAGAANVGIGAAGIAGSVVTAPAHLFNWLDRMYQTNKRGGYYAGNATPYLTDYTDAVTSARAEALNKDYGTRDLGFLGEKGFGDIYQLGQSMAQSLAYGNLVGEGATLLIFFGQAADQSYADAIDRGYNNEQAAAVSFLSGLAEVMGEKIGLDHLLDADAALTKSTLRYLLEQAGIEGLEEGATDMLNVFGDELAARLTGGKSDIQRQVEALMRENGMSYEDALRAVWKEQARETAWSMAGGFLSGAGSGFIQSGGNILHEHQQKRQTEKFKKTASELLQNLTADQVKGYSVYELQRLKNYAQSIGNQKAVETLDALIQQKQAAPAQVEDVGEETGKSFGRRLAEEATAQEPELPGSLKVLFDFKNDHFAKQIRQWSKNENTLRQMYEWALWNEEFDKADIIRDLAAESGFNLNKPMSAEEQAPPPGDEEAPPPPTNEDASPVTAEPVGNAEETAKMPVSLEEMPNYSRDVTAEEMEAASGAEFVQQLLWDGRVSNTDAERIARDSQLSTVFEGVTGFQLTGTLHERVKLIQHAARGFYTVQQRSIAQGDEARTKAAEEREAEARKQREREAREQQRQQNAKQEDIDRQSVRESSYDSYVRGILLNESKGVSNESAREIASDPRLREAWERITGKTLPENQKSAIKMIRETDRSRENLNKNPLYNTADDVANRLANSAESSTIEAENKPNNPLVNESKEADNGGEQVIQEQRRTESPENSLDKQGGQSSLDRGGHLKDGLGEGSAADSGRVEQPEAVQSRDSESGTSELPAGADTKVQSGITPSSQKRVPSWVKNQRIANAIKSGLWHGRRSSFKAGAGPFNGSQNGNSGYGIARDGERITKPSPGTIAHYLVDMAHIFGIKNGNLSIWNVPFAQKSNKKVTALGMSDTGKIAVSVFGNNLEQVKSLGTLGHELLHNTFFEKFKGNHIRVKANADGSFSVDARREYTHKTLVDVCGDVFGKANAEAMANKITDWLLHSSSTNYARVYSVQKGVSDLYKSELLRSKGSLAVDDLNSCLAKHVSEEFVVEAGSSGGWLREMAGDGLFDYSTARKLEEKVRNRLLTDKVVTQEQFDKLVEARDLMQNPDFVSDDANTIDLGNGEQIVNVSDRAELNNLINARKANPDAVARANAHRYGNDAAENPIIQKKNPTATEEKALFELKSSGDNAEQAFADARSSPAGDAGSDGSKSPPKKIKLADHDSVASASKAISGMKTVFDGGVEGMPDVIALDKNGRTYTVPETVKSAVKQVKNAVRGVGEGAHPMRSLEKLIKLYDNFASPGSDMAQFTTDEINQAIADIKEIGNSKELSDNQKVMRLETATTRALNLIGAQMRNVNEAFEMDFQIAKLIAGDGKSGVRNRLARGYLAKASSGATEAYQWWKSMKINPTTLFKMVGKFDKASGNVAYEIANKIEHATAVSQMNYAIAMQEFNELRSMKGFNEFATNKTKCSVKLNGIELTEQEAVDFIKRVNTLNQTIIGGHRRIDTISGFSIKGSDGKYVYIDSKAVKGKWVDIAKSMENSLSPVAKAYMESASKALHGLGEKVSAMKRDTTGIGFWTMEKGIYYPLQYHSPSHEDFSLDNNIQNFFGPTGQSVTQQRTREEGGYVIIQPSALTVDNYINRASSYTGFGKLASQLAIMDAPGAGLNGLSNMVANNLGKNYGKVMRNYVNDMNNVMRPEGELNKLARKLRMNLQKGALMTSVSVPIKQVASYWNAIGVLSPESVMKAYRFKGLKAKGEGAKNWLLAYRAVGGIDPTVSEVLNNKDFLRGLKKKAKILDTFDKAISIMDYRTVDNLYSATILDVKNTFPDIDINSEEFAQLVNAKFEEVVINTQPIYTALARSESMRTNNEIIRNLSMFQTQQTQNFNRLVTTLGEARAAKGTIGELLADKAFKQTVGGQIAAQVEFGLLGVLADLVLHRWKKYRRDDDEDKFDVGKFAERWALNTIESSAGTFWFGDQAAKFVIDRIAKAVNDDTDIHEYYGISIGALSTVKSTYDSFGYFMERPTVYNAKRLIVNLSTIAGVPVGNTYNNVNALVMWGASLLGENPDKYDDVIKMAFGEETTKDKENRQADKLYLAVSSGNTEKANKLFEYYGSKAEGDEQIGKAIVRRYQGGKLSKDDAIKELREYAAMSKYDAEHYIAEATARMELGFDYDKLKEKYQDGEITRQEAVSARQKYGLEKSKDAEAEVQKWSMELDTGYDYGDLEKHFASGDVTREEAIRYRVKYGGEERKDAEKAVAKWQCEVDTDIPYDSLTDYYVKGEISKSKLVSYYQKYGLYEADKAQEKADIAEFIWDKRDQLGSATAAAVRNYNEYCYDIGISKEFYIEHYFAVGKVEGVKNAKGNTISGSVVTNKIAYIDALNLSDAQKTALANACNIPLKSLRKYHAPWL